MSVPVVDAPARSRADRSSLTPARVAGLLYPVLALLVLLALVEVAILLAEAVTGDDLPAAQYPLPHGIVESLVLNVSVIADAAVPTVLSSLMGFAAGLVAGAAGAIALWWSRTLDMAFGPLLAIIPMIPVIAVAPLLNVMIADPLTARILLAAWVTCFPILVNMSRGLDTVDPLRDDLAATYAMSRYQRLVKVNLPSALPHFFAGARIGATWSVIGSIVLEFTGNGVEGLGLLMLQVSYLGSGIEVGGGSDAYFLWAAAVGSAIVGLLLYGAVALAEARLLRGRSNPEVQT